MRTPVKTIRLITNSVAIEIATRWTRNSSTAVTGRRRAPPRAGGPAPQFQDVPLMRIRPSGTAL